jgi:hypothetical protein
VIDETPTPTRSRSLRYATIACAAIVVIAAVVIGITFSSGSALPVSNASYKCVPGPQIPQLKPGKNGTLTTTYGSFTATFRATEPGNAPENGLDTGTPFNGTLTMTQGGTTWTLPRPANPNVAQINVMCVIAFQRERHPGVMVEGFTGGAHCCEVPVIYLYNHVENRYAKVVDMSPNNYKDPHAFDDNEGFIPKVVGHQVLLTTGDGQFSYAFGCYACEVLPIVLDSVGTDGLSDVTPQYPSLVAADARATWKYVLGSVKAETAAVPRIVPLPFGFLAPWVADECVLGRGASAWSAVLRLQREGKLNDALYHQYATNRGSFVANLRSFLLRTDYCTGQI